MNPNIKQITDTSFEQQVLQSPVPVLVDYWAEWCGPCKMIAPILDESAHTYAGRLEIAKVNVDENQAIAARYHVRGIPTLMLFKGGEVVATKVGAVSKSQLATFIESNL
jgi:thioredoxin 1